MGPARAARIGQLSAAEDAWPVSMVPLAALTNQNVPDTKLNGMLNSDIVKTIQQTSGGIKFGSIIQLSAEAVTRSAQDATALADVVRFLANMVQMTTPQAGQAAATALVQSLNVQ